jgi:DNA-binding response OmpR family regulator
MTGTKQAIELGPLRLDLGEHTLQVGTDVVRLTGTEFRLLQFLMRHGTSVVPTADVARHVWGYDDAPARDAVRVTVHRLRRKLSDGAKREGLIHTVPGVGLQLDPAEQASS